MSHQNGSVFGIKMVVILEPCFKTERHPENGKGILQSFIHLAFDCGSKGLATSVWGTPLLGCFQGKTKRTATVVVQSEYPSMLLSDFFGLSALTSRRRSKNKHRRVWVGFFSWVDIAAISVHQRLSKGLATAIHGQGRPKTPVGFNSRRTKAVRNVEQPPCEAM